MGEKDITEKTLEAYDDVFADIINGFLFAGQQVVAETALEEASPISAYKVDGKLHEHERDVAKYWLDGPHRKAGVRIALLGIENQTSIDADMPLRVIGYDGAAYRAELLKERTERYPVVTLVLYFGNKRWTRNRSLYEVVDVPAQLAPYVNDYRINVFEVAYLSEEQIERFHSDFKIVADYFVHSRLDPDYRPKNPQAFRHVDALLKMLAVVMADQRFVELKNWEGGEPKNMCEALDRAIARGREAGLQEGRSEERILTLVELVRDGLLTAEQAAERGPLSAEEIESLAAEGPQAFNPA